MSFKDAPERNFAAIVQENEQLRFAMTELCHRTKNLVAIIQSIARQTMRQTATNADFDVRFTGRLDALGRSLDLLIDGDWRGARLNELCTPAAGPIWSFGWRPDFGARIAYWAQSGGSPQHRSGAARVGDQRFQIRRSLCARGQSRRALEAHERQCTVTLHHDLARGQWSDGDRARASRLWSTGSPAGSCSGSLGKGDAQVPTGRRQVDTRHSGCSNP